MNMSKNVILGILGVLLLAAVGFATYFANQPAEIQYVNQTNTVVVVDNATQAKVDALASQLASLDEFQDKADEKLQNDTAKTLVLSEIDTKDFKKAVLTLLENNSISNKSIDSYKDLEIYLVKVDSSEVGSDDSAEVIATIKVSGVEDADEELDFKAKLVATFVVTDLVIDDNFEDAEVEYTLELTRVYD